MKKKGIRHVFVDICRVRSVRVQVSVPTGFFTHDLCQTYDQGEDNPECPDRIEAIEDQMLACGLNRLVVPMQCQSATVAEVLRAHDADYIERLRRSSLTDTPVRVSPDTFVNSLSFDAAMKSAGAAISAVREVCAGTVRNAFACVRPPGHHAGRGWGHGFCLINSVACAAKYALDELGLKRVVIVDIDVHRADGTEDIVKEDPRIKLFSLYQNTAFPFGVPDADSPNIVNAPLPEGTDGSEVIRIIEKEWLAQIAAFKPDLLLLSAGFDAHRDEKQALFKLTEFDYSLITKDLMRLAHVVCHDRLVSILEGGYNIRSLARSAVAHIATLTRNVAAS